MFVAKKGGRFITNLTGLNPGKRGGNLTELTLVLRLHSVSHDDGGHSGTVEQEKNESVKVRFIIEKYL